MESIKKRKSEIKVLFDLVMRFITYPFYLNYLILKRMFGSRKAFGSIMQPVSLIPGVSGEWLRRGVLQWVTSKPLNDCCICFGTTFSDPRVIIGRGVYIGTRCDIGYADIGRDCILGSGVHVLSGQKQHLFQDKDTLIKDQGGEFSKVIIGQDSWIGNGAIIANHVGAGCVIGAGSVVVSNIEDYAVAVGNPARVIRLRK